MATMRPVIYMTLGGLLILHARLREAGFDLTPQQLRLVLIIAAQREQPLSMTEISRRAGCHVPQTCTQLKGLTSRGLVILSDAPAACRRGRPLKQARLTSLGMQALEGKESS